MERLVRASRARAIPLVVDSRFRMHQFHHVSAITPNVTEVEEAYDCKLDNDLAAIEAKAREIVKSQSLEALLVTRGKFGMSLLVCGQRMQHIPIFGSDQVADVTGAGDTVIAAFTLSLAAGAGYLDAARLSNYAGGLVVMKRGTATVTLDELRQAIRKDAGRH
jgi:rfaE bifunctional protein kinase chain/domain